MGPVADPCIDMGRSGPSRTFLGPNDLARPELCRNQFARESSIELFRISLTRILDSSVNNFPNLLVCQQLVN